MSDDLEAMARRISALEDALRALTGSGASGGGSGGGSSRPVSASISPTEWRSLGDKLDQLEGSLTDKEKVVMLTLLGAAAGSMAQGGLQEAPAAAATQVKLNGALDKVKLSDGLLSIGQFSKGAIGSGGGSPVADSVNVGGDVTSVHGDWSKDLKDLGDRGRWAAINPATTLNPAAGGKLGGPAAGGGFGFSGGGGFR